MIAIFFMEVAGAVAAPAIPKIARIIGRVIKMDQFFFMILLHNQLNSEKGHLSWIKPWIWNKSYGNMIAIGPYIIVVKSFKGKWFSPRFPFQLEKKGIVFLK